MIEIPLAQNSESDSNRKWLIGTDWIILGFPTEEAVIIKIDVDGHNSLLDIFIVPLSNGLDSGLVELRKFILKTAISIQAFLNGKEVIRYIVYPRNDVTPHFHPVNMEGCTDTVFALSFLMEGWDTKCGERLLESDAKSYYEAINGCLL